MSCKLKQKLSFIFISYFFNRNLMHSLNFEISYNSSGILANLCSDGMKNWSNTSSELKNISSELVSQFLFIIESKNLNFLKILFDIR
jgi:hypothetical protein